MHAHMINPCHSANFKVTESLLKVNKIVKWNHPATFPDLWVNVQLTERHSLPCDLHTTSTTSYSLDEQHQLVDTKYCKFIINGFKKFIQWTCYYEVFEPDNNNIVYM